MARISAADGEAIELQIGGMTIKITGSMAGSGKRKAARPASQSADGGIGRKKRRFSAVSRAKMAESQRKRWAGIHTKGKNAPPPIETPAPAKKQRTMSAAARARLAASAKARWAAAKKAGKNAL